MDIKSGLLTHRYTLLLVATTGAAVEGSDGSRDCCPNGGSGPCPPAAAPEQGFAAALGSACAAAERPRSSLPKSYRTRATTTGTSS